MSTSKSTSAPEFKRGMATLFSALKDGKKHTFSSLQKALKAKKGIFGRAYRLGRIGRKLKQFDILVERNGKREATTFQLVKGSAAKKAIEEKNERYASLAKPKSKKTAKKASKKQVKAKAKAAAARHSKKSTPKKAHHSHKSSKKSSKKLTAVPVGASSSEEANDNSALES